MTMFALLLLSILPRESVARDGVDVLERQEFFDGEGRLVFVQWIGWQGYRVRFWRLDKGDKCLTRDFANRAYELEWCEDGKHRQVWAKWFEESWEQYDKELEDRQYLPAEKRQPLRK